MAGRYPTTVTAELNRLAYGSGTSYPTEFEGDAGAANHWAGTTGLEVVGALNAKAGLTGSNMQELDGVCNVLAGTSGLGAPEALRRVTS